MAYRHERERRSRSRGRSDGSPRLDYRCTASWDRPLPPRERSVPTLKPNVPPARVLLKKRLLELDSYRLELNTKRAPLTKEQKLQEYGRTMMPIPVPLACGETQAVYETRFLEWLDRRGVRLSNLRDDPVRERSYRITFAMHSARNEAEREQIIPERTKQEQHRASSERRPSLAAEEQPPTKKPKPTTSHSPGASEHQPVASSLPLSVSSPASSSSSTPVTQSTTANSTRVKKPLVPGPPHSIDSSLAFPTACSVELPPVAASLAAFVTAYMTCGCRQCLIKCTSRMAAHITALESRKPANCCRNCASSATGSPSRSQTKSRGRVMDLTNDDDLLSPKRKDASIRKLQPHEVKRRRSASDQHELESIVETPIEQKMLSEYDELNDRILANERVLETSVVRLQDSSMEEIKEATKSQDDIDEMRSLIHDEMDNRNAALAMLVVYLWRKSEADLLARIDAKDATHVQHIQQTCHQKCAEYATQLAAKRALHAKTKLELDQRLTKPAGSDPKHFQSVQQLGERLTQTESEIHKLQTARRQEFATLIHFDGHVRHLIRTVLGST